MPRILVADDNANIQKMVALAFEERGIQVISVGNGEAAVRRIPDVSPDLVLADIFMPVRNGYGVCEAAAPDLIVLDDWGFPILPDGPVPRDLLRQARKAINDCPMVALAWENKEAAEGGRLGRWGIRRR